MSDSVVKLRIDSKEYDANIKRAGDALTQYFQKVREGGGTLMHLDEGVLEAVKAMGELGTQANNTKGGLRELTQATTDMTIAYRNLTDEEKNSPIGQAMAQSIRQMTDRAGQMRDAMDDVNLSIKNVASDTSTFDQFAQGIGVATAGFQGLTGAGKLLGIEMGNDVEVIAKLQAAMAVTNSLTTIQAALQKESALMQGLNAVKTAATAVAQQAYAVATGEATVAQIAFNVAANANPYGLILGAIGLVVGAIGAFVAVMGDSTEETDKNTEALKRQEHEAEIMKRRHQDMQQSIGNSVGSIEAKYKMLQLQWNSLKSDAEKTQFIKDQKNAFSDLGLKVNSVTQAQEALVNQAPKVIAALKAVAEAEAYSDLYKKSIQKKATEWDNRIKETNTGDFYKKAHLGDAITDEEAKAAGVRTLSQRKVNATNPNSYNAAGTTKTESLTQEEINKVNVYRAQQAAQMRKQREKEYDDEINIYSSKWEEAQQKALTAQGNISGLLTSETKGGSGSGGNKNKEDVTYAEDSIMAQEILVQDLTQKWKTASAELKDGYLEQLNEAKDTLAEMTEGSDPDKLIEDQFPDMSKQNFDTGYSDSAQAKYDSARQDFALRGISNSDISSYISSIKGAIDQSDLGSDLYNKLTENLKDADAMQSVLTQAMASGAKAADLAPIAEELKAKLLEGEIDESTWEEFIDKINALITDSDLKIHFDFDTSEVETGLQKTEKDTKAIATAAQNVSSVVGTIGQAFNSIEDPAAKVMGTVMQAIATVASGYATATAQAAALGPWAWIAFAATGLATMISTISAIHQQTGYASGGIIPGNSYSGDNMVGMLPNGATVGLDAGELILNRSQQSSIASQLEGGPGFGNMQLETRIDAEELIIMLNNNGLRRGLGRFING